MSKKKFVYENSENLDSVFNYLTMLNKGLKNRHVSLGNDSELIDFELPDTVDLTIEAENRKDAGSLVISLGWQSPEPGKSDREKEEKKKAKEEKKKAKEEKKKAKEERKKAEKAAQEAEKQAREASEKTVSKPKPKPKPKPRAGKKK